MISVHEMFFSNNQDAAIYNPSKGVTFKMCNNGINSNGYWQ